MARLTLAVSILFVMTLTTSCGSSLPTVLAATPFSLSECTAEEFVHPGTVLQADKSQAFEESGDYLEFASPVCRSNSPDAHVVVSYSTKFDHNVQLINLQMGSGIHTTLEWAFWVKFDTPDGRHYSISRQFDKHQDVRGNELSNIPVHLLLPAGTVITIDRPHAECISDPDGAGGVAAGSCLTGQKIELISN